MTTLFQQLDRNDFSPLESAVRNIETASEDVGVYLRYAFQTLEPFSHEATYREHPERVEHCFGHAGLQEDINEIVYHIENNIPSHQHLALFQDLYRSTAENSVFAYFVQQICEALGVRIPAPTLPFAPERSTLRFRMPNILFDRRQLEQFLQMCELKPVADQGKGSHMKWIDSETGRFVKNSYVSEKHWLKNTIRQMLENGLPVERIKTACDRLKIDFTIL